MWGQWLDRYGANVIASEDEDWSQVDQKRMDKEGRQGREVDHRRVVMTNEYHRLKGIRGGERDCTLKIRNLEKRDQGQYTCIHYDVQPANHGKYVFDVVILYVEESIHPAPGVNMTKEKKISLDDVTDKNISEVVTESTRVEMVPGNFSDSNSTARNSSDYNNATAREDPMLEKDANGIGVLILSTRRGDNTTQEVQTAEEVEWVMIEELEKKEILFQKESEAKRSRVTRRVSRRRKVTQKRGNWSEEAKPKMDPILRQMEDNYWYNLMKYTGRINNKEECYICSKAKQSSLLIVNTRYSWKKYAADEMEYGRKIRDRKRKIVGDRMQLIPHCEAQCLQYLGSKEYYDKYVLYGTISVDVNVEENMSIKQVGFKCKPMDMRGDFQVPQGIKLELMGRFECFEKTGLVEVGYLNESLCSVIWDLSHKRSVGLSVGELFETDCAILNEEYRSQIAATNVKKGKQTHPTPMVCPYQYATEAVADQFWTCDGKVLLATLPKNWNGRCARVEAVQPIVIIPMDDLSDTPKSVTPSSSRTKRGLKELMDKGVELNALGMPVGVPEEFQALSVTVTTIASIFLPAYSISMQSAWINLIFYNQQRMLNETYELFGALGAQLDATSRMAAQNRQALDFLLAATGGVCEIFGDQCCTFIPQNTGPEGNFTKAMKRLKSLKDETQSLAGFKHDWVKWIEKHLGEWGIFFAKIGSIVLLCLGVLCLVLCCGVPLIRRLVGKGIERAMNIQAVQMAVLRGRKSQYP